MNWLGAVLGIGWRPGARCAAARGVRASAKQRDVATISCSCGAPTCSRDGYLGGVQGLNKLNPVLVNSMSMESGISVGCGVLMSHAILYS